METYVSDKVLSRFNMELLSRSIVGEHLWAKASPDRERVAIKGRLLDKEDETVAFNFRMVKSANTWKVYDVALEGVDLIYTYKSNFKSTLEEGGVAKLAAELHKKNLALAAIK
jgi:ABC-type transporter MlaC component